MSKCYILHLWVEPGGADKSNYYYVNTLQEVVDILYHELKDPYLPVWYGMTITLYICKKIKSKSPKYIPYINFDLMPYVKYQIGEFAPIEFKESDSLPIGFIKDSDIEMDEPGPFNFKVKEVNEVARYLKYNLYERVRIMQNQGIKWPEKDPIKTHVIVTISNNIFTDIPNYKSSRKYDKIEIIGWNQDFNYGLN